MGMRPLIQHRFGIALLSRPAAARHADAVAPMENPQAGGPGYLRQIAQEIGHLHRHAEGRGGFVADGEA